MKASIKSGRGASAAPIGSTLELTGLAKGLKSKAAVASGLLAFLIAFAAVAREWRAIQCTYIHSTDEEERPITVIFATSGTIPGEPYALKDADIEIEGTYGPPPNDFYDGSAWATIERKPREGSPAAEEEKRVFLERVVVEFDDENMTCNVTVYNN